MAAGRAGVTQTGVKTLIRVALLVLLLPTLASARLVCSLDRPVVEQTQPDVASVYADHAIGGVMWQATGGAFDTASGAQVTWRAGNAAAGTYRLTARAGDESCAVDVLVAAGTRAARSSQAALGSEAARDMLQRGQDEAAGYGLYSYILLGARPDPDGEARDLAVLTDYLRLDDIRLGSFFPRAQLNATFVPVEQPAPAKPDARWVLDNYDFARARLLISHLHGCAKNFGDGPLIVSVLKPLGADAPDLCLTQDLSTAPLSVIGFWMRAFRDQTTQHRVWDRRSIGGIVLDVRTMLAVAALGLPEAEAAVVKWVR